MPEIRLVTHQISGSLCITVSYRIISFFDSVGLDKLDGRRREDAVEQLVDSIQFRFVDVQS